MNQNLPQLGFSQWKIPSGFWVVPKIIITTYMLNQKRKLPKNWGLSRKRERECSETTFDLEVTWSIITLIFPMCITVILLWQTIKLYWLFSIYHQTLREVTDFVKVLLSDGLKNFTKWKKAWQIVSLANDHFKRHRVTYEWPLNYEWPFKGYYYEEALVDLSWIFWRLLLKYVRIVDFYWILLNYEWPLNY